MVFMLISIMCMQHNLMQYEIICNQTKQDKGLGIGLPVTIPL